ncbi:hypothetical protein ARMGADRAFT_1078465 [Armillaria gallica]|uniref:Uncharacterized protein n=1 Tax=Armillaria gallica TaxID=47427 RepID=A0A2H3DZR4_ARMGA|nr:hypothetical protein ARMGADRAFT_1078465 [Armillaria gallica]
MSDTSHLPPPDLTCHSTNLGIKLLPEAEYINGIHRESPKLSPILSIHSLYAMNPDPPSDDTI